MSVFMQHSGGPVVETTREAYDVVWQDKGWQLVDEQAAVAQELTGGRTTDLSSMTKADLVELAGARGVEVPDGATKADLVELLTGSV